MRRKTSVATLLWRKTPEFNLKKTENNKTPDMQNVKKSQNQAWNVR